MPLSREDCIQLVREIERLLRQYDPAALELVLRATQPNDDPRRYFISLLGTISRIYSERSSGTLGPTLDRINHFVRLQDRSPIKGIAVTLSPAERELYGTDEVDLARLPDRSEFLGELERVLGDVIRDVEAGERQE